MVVAFHDATLTTRRALPLTWTGLSPVGPRQLPWRTGDAETRRWSGVGSATCVLRQAQRMRTFLRATKIFPHPLMSAFARCRRNFFSRQFEGAWTGGMDRCTDLGAGVAATVDRSLIRGLDTDRTMGSSRGCLALSTSMGLKPLPDEAEGSPDLRPAPRLLHRRCVGWCLGSPLLRFFYQASSLWGLWSCGYRACDIHQIHRPDATSALARRLRGGGAGDGPDEAERLAGDRRHRHRRELAARDELAVARAQAMAGLVGDGAHGRRLAGSGGLRSLGRPRIGPGRLDQRRAGALVAGLGNAAAAHPLAGRVLADAHPEIAHELARTAEAPGIADLGHDRGRIDQLVAAQHLQRLDQPGQRPARHQLGDVIGQPIAPRRRLIERLEQPADQQPMRRFGERETPQPGPVLLRPGLAGIEI